MKYFEIKRAEKVILEAVRAVASPTIYRILCSLDRVHRLPEELPCYADDASSMQKIAKLANLVAESDSYWDSAPSHVPVAEDEVDNLAQIARSSSLSKEASPERIEQILSEMREKGVEKQTVRQKLQMYLKAYAKGDLRS